MTSWEIKPTRNSMLLISLSSQADREKAHIIGADVLNSVCLEPVCDSQPLGIALPLTNATGYILFTRAPRHLLSYKD
ncbi:hypothetical protein XENTR_v10011834 [Xenopus tropicalis]|nr:hypothetical protein XENTR_v10011834 [Xenopus tropicalis]